MYLVCPIIIDELKKDCWKKGCHRETAKSFLGHRQDFLRIGIQGNFQMKEAHCMADQPIIASRARSTGLVFRARRTEMYRHLTFLRNQPSAERFTVYYSGYYFDCCSSKDFSHAFVHLLAASSALLRLPRPFHSSLLPRVC